MLDDNGSKFVIFNTATMIANGLSNIEEYEKACEVLDVQKDSAISLLNDEYAAGPSARLLMRWCEFNVRYKNNEAEVIKNLNILRSQPNISNYVKNRIKKLEEKLSK